MEFVVQFLYHYYVDPEAKKFPPSPQRTAIPQQLPSQLMMPMAPTADFGFPLLAQAPVGSQVPFLDQGFNGPFPLLGLSGAPLAHRDLLADTDKAIKSVASLRTKLRVCSADKPNCCSSHRM